MRIENAVMLPLGVLLLIISYDIYDTDHMTSMSLLILGVMFLVLSKID